MGLGTGTGWSNLRDGPTCEISSKFTRTLDQMWAHNPRFEYLELLN